jgi:plasmid stabilization system protein ParE
MKVRWSKRALTQLRAARDRFEEDNPAAAKGFVEAAETLANLLGDFPGMGVRTDEEVVIMFPLVRYRYLIFTRFCAGRKFESSVSVTHRKIGRGE